MPTDPDKASQGPRVWPFPESAPDTAQGEGDEAGPHAADADLLGDAVPMKPPAPTQRPPAASAADGKQGAAPGPAEDENQPSLLGERNLPHAA
jgi:hypothetical protein